MQKIQSYPSSYHVHKWKSLTYIYNVGKDIFFLLFNGARSYFYLYMIVYFTFLAVPGILFSYSVPNRFLRTRYYSFLFGSYSVCIILCMKIWLFCAVILISSSIKKPTQNNTEQKKSVLWKYYNWSVFFLTLFNCMKKWTFSGPKHICPVGVTSLYRMLNYRAINKWIGFQIKKKNFFGT